jgi:hypothetical protein
MINAQDIAAPFLDSLTARHRRTCQRCKKPFNAVGFLILCEVCEGLPDSPPEPIRRELGESWPERHRAQLASLHGPGLIKAQALLPLVREGDSMLVLAGDRGRGKTQIATWLAWQRGQNGLKPGIYAKAFDIFTDVKNTWSKQSTGSEAGVLDRYKKAAFLAIDECHERGETDWENRTFRNVLDHRYDACLPTVIIGNWREAGQVRDSLGASIVDRISETGGIVFCDWPSYRMQPS